MIKFAHVKICQFITRSCMFQCKKFKRTYASNQYLWFTPELTLPWADKVDRASNPIQLTVAIQICQTLSSIWANHLNTEQIELSSIQMSKAFLSDCIECIAIFKFITHALDSNFIIHFCIIQIHQYLGVRYSDSHWPPSPSMTKKIVLVQSS